MISVQYARSVKISTVELCYPVTWLQLRSPRERSEVVDTIARLYCVAQFSLVLELHSDSAAINEFYNELAPHKAEFQVISTSNNTRSG